MANIFLTVLGTGKYLETNYKYGKNIYTTSFIQEALISEFCNDWSEDDKICIFLTKGAKNTNWSILKNSIENLKIKAQIVPIDIKDGQSEEEIWEIFDELYKSVSEDDNIIFDITHGFRSLPILVIVFLNYAKVLKNINLSGIYYGAFEAKDKDNNLTPIFDLTALSMLQDWTNGINLFLQTGNSSFINKLAKDKIEPILKKTQGKDNETKTLQLVMKTLENFSKLISTNRLMSLIDQKEKNAFSYEMLKNNLKQSQYSFIKPLNPLFDKIEKKIDYFNDNDIKNGFAAVKWCIDYNLIQQGFTLLQETIISILVNEIFGREYLKDEKKRSIISGMLSRKGQGILYTNKNQEEEKSVSLAETIIESKYLNFAKEIYNPLTERRNDLNHASCNHNATSPDILVMDLKKYYEKVKNYNF